MIVICTPVCVVKGRSRSAPARGGGQTTDGATCPPRPWAAFREWAADDQIEIKVYDIDDAEKMSRWRQQENEVKWRRLATILSFQNSFRRKK